MFRSASLCPALPEIAPSPAEKRRTSRRTRLAGLVVGAAVTAVTCGTASAANGPDVSAWQHPQSVAINWNKVAAAGNSFVFIKATEGSSYVNPWWSTDRSGARAAGLAVGAYDFAEPGSTSGTSEARHFAAVIGAQNGRGQLPPVLDLELTGGRSPSSLIRWVGEWLRTTRTLTHRTPMIYVSPSFWAAHLRNTHSYSHYPLWVADWGVSSPILPGGWNHWLFWQYTASARVAGLRGAIDEDRYAGTTAQLRAMAHMSTGGSVVIHPKSGGGHQGHKSHKLWTRMHLSVPSKAKALSPVQVSGAVTTYGGRSVPHAHVVLQRLGHEGKWHPFDKLVATKTGWFGHRYRVTWTSKVRAVASATKRFKRAVSLVKTIQVTG